jgi:hypothetical protein
LYSLHTAALDIMQDETEPYQKELQIITQKEKED